MSSTLTYGMVGGGPGAFIGDAHRKAIAVDSSAKLVAGCFSRSPEKTKAQGEALGLEPARCYADYKEMAAAESQREDGIDFVVVVTPNATHYEICKAFLEAGIHVACDKPLATDSAQARELADLAEEKGLLFMVTYTYMGHVTAKYIRDLIKAGEIGTVRTVMAEYPQGWLYNENDWGGKQGEWRCDPARSGRVNCLGDLGTHVENAVATMTGLKVKRVLAKMDVVVPGRKLDDNDQILVEYEGGATGVNWTSQFAIGCDNHGEYVGLDVKAMRTTRDEDSYKHLENSLNIFRALEEKVERFDYDFQKKCVENRDFEALEMYVMNLLMGLA